MFFAKKIEDKGLTEAIDRLYTRMHTLDPFSDDYQITVDQLTKLYAIKENSTPKRVSADTLAMVAGNLAGIVLIVGHEKAHVVTSKALAFVLKAR